MTAQPLPIRLLLDPLLAISLAAALLLWSGTAQGSAPSYQRKDAIRVLTEQLGSLDAANREFEFAENIATKTPLTIDLALFGIVALTTNLKEEDPRRFVFAALSDLAVITDRQASTFREAAIAAGAMAGMGTAKPELISVFIRHDLRADLIYECIASNKKLRAQSPEARNLRAAQLLKSGQISGQIGLQCVCNAIMKQAGEPSAGAASSQAGAAFKLAE